MVEFGTCHRKVTQVHGLFTVTPRQPSLFKYPARRHLTYRFGACWSLLGIRILMGFPIKS